MFSLIGTIECSDRTLAHCQKREHNLLNSLQCKRMRSRNKSPSRRITFTWTSRIISCRLCVKGDLTFPGQAFSPSQSLINFETTSASKALDWTYHSRFPFLSGCQGESRSDMGCPNWRGRKRRRFLLDDYAAFASAIVGITVQGKPHATGSRRFTITQYAAGLKSINPTDFRHHLPEYHQERLESPDKGIWKRWSTEELTGWPCCSVTPLSGSGGYGGQHQQLGCLQFALKWENKRLSDGVENADQNFRSMARLLRRTVSLYPEISTLAEYTPFQ